MKRLINISGPSSEAEETSVYTFTYRSSSSSSSSFYYYSLDCRVKHLKVLFTDWEQFANFSY